MERAPRQPAREKNLEKNCPLVHRPIEVIGGVAVSWYLSLRRVRTGGPPRIWPGPSFTLVFSLYDPRASERERAAAAAVEARVAAACRRVNVSALYVLQNVSSFMYDSYLSQRKLIPKNSE